MQAALPLPAAASQIVQINKTITRACRRERVKELPLLVG